MKILCKEMDDYEIKHEFRGDSSHLCRTCLSNGRKLRPLQDLESVFAKITLEHHIKDMKTILICWQCSSLLRKVALFQDQVRRADQLLLNNQSFMYGPLSNLTSVTLSETHETIYLVEENTDKNENTQNNKEDKDRNENLNKVTPHSILPNDSDIENTEMNIELKKQTKSRWAIKKSQQNKRPKFKVRTDFNKTFKEIEVNSEMFRQNVDIEKRAEYIKLKKFKCVYCVLIFTNKNELEKHIQNRHCKKVDKDVGICEVKDCEKRHLLSDKKHHLYKCLVCEFICQNEMRSWHFKEHKKVFQCLKCHLQFGSRRQFYTHHKEWHERFVCHHCGITFKMRYCIKDHLRKQHSPFKCVPCNKSFARYNGLWLHNKIAHAPHPARYNQLNWNLYTRRTAKKIRIPCTACDKVFTKNIYMKDHYNLVHLKVFKYRCETCDKNFVRNADLVKHNRKIHEGILPPKNKMCHICGKGFTTNKILFNHLRTHSSQRNAEVECYAAK